MNKVVKGIRTVIVTALVALGSQLGEASTVEFDGETITYQNGTYVRDSATGDLISTFKSTAGSLTLGNKPVFARVLAVGGGGAGGGRGVIVIRRSEG